MSDENVTPSAQNLTTPYEPVALYYEEADSIEYIRADVPAVYKRIDGALTLIFDMKHRDDLIGFQIKGFRNFYLKDEVATRLGGDFQSLVGILERVLTDVGGPVVDGYRRKAYDRARQIAIEDRVSLTDFPRTAFAQ